VSSCALKDFAHTELAALARARRDTDALPDRLGRARKLLTVARRAAAEVPAITPNIDGWRMLAEAEYAHVLGEAHPERWADAAATWYRLERPPAAAYCRWRQAGALVSAGASRSEASAPLREAHAVAARLRAKPLARELERLAERPRLDLAPPDTRSADPPQDLERILGLTAREAQVLKLIARGYTNREIAEALVISVKTAGVHVSHILRKLDAPNRREAAAIAHRVSP
jgi:DNA-binding CsgD family transcriptional regulator